MYRHEKLYGRNRRVVLERQNVRDGHVDRSHRPARKTDWILEVPLEAFSVEQWRYDINSQEGRLTGSNFFTVRRGLRMRQKSIEEAARATGMDVNMYGLGEEQRVVVVENLNPDTSVDDLKYFMEDFGAVVSCKMMDASCHVVFEEDASARKAVDDMNGKTADGRVLIVYSIPLAQPDAMEEVV
ncbi:hypothetical protein HKX48_005283 [Thoreauomyces humboldtii]|nr:hypothetical protein HKX48_005283 [Thoreauomyces humboldtii]